jgi:hypothetical protein
MEAVLDPYEPGYDMLVHRSFYVVVRPFGISNDLHNCKEASLVWFQRSQKKIFQTLGIVSFPISPVENA